MVAIYDVPFEPKWIDISSAHVVLADKKTILVRQFRSVEKGGDADDSNDSEHKGLKWSAPASAYASKRPEYERLFKLKVRSFSYIKAKIYALGVCKLIETRSLARERRQLKQDIIHSMELQPDADIAALGISDKYMIVADSSQQVYLLDLQSCVLETTFKLSFKPYSFAFNLDSTSLAVLASNTELTIWNIHLPKVGECWCPTHSPPFPPPKAKKKTCAYINLQRLSFSLVVLSSY